LCPVCSADGCDDPEVRFIRVLQYYLAGWHIKPKGVKKPYVPPLVSPRSLLTYSRLPRRYNPVLGEFFRCRYDYPNGTQGFYIAEQGANSRPFLPDGYLSSPVYPLSAVSHHPPISAFYYVSPANKVAIVGELRPKSKFLGNSVSTTMEGQSRITLTGRPEDAGNCVPTPHEAERRVKLTCFFFRDRPCLQSTC